MAISRLSDSYQSSTLSGLKTYAPILWITGVSALAAGFVCIGFVGDFALWMNHWMGLLLMVFALFKLFDVRGFAEDFQRYDLLAARSRVYAFVYPFIELTLGLMLFAGFLPSLTYTLIALIFGFGLIGVLRALRRGDNLQCACVGRLFNLPLSKVAVIENSAMVVMSLMMLLGRFA